LPPRFIIDITAVVLIRGFRQLHLRDAASYFAGCLFSPLLLAFIFALAVITTISPISHSYFRHFLRSPYFRLHYSPFRHRYFLFTIDFRLPAIAAYLANFIFFHFSPLSRLQPIERRRID